MFLEGLDKAPGPFCLYSLRPVQGVGYPDYEPFHTLVLGNPQNLLDILGQLAAKEMARRQGKAPWAADGQPDTALSQVQGQQFQRSIPLRAPFFGVTQVLSSSGQALTDSFRYPA